MYKVTIEKIEEKEVKTSKYEKIADTGNKHDNGPVYGYVENTERKEIKEEVYIQVLERLALGTVIKTINESSVSK